MFLGADHGLGSSDIALHLAGIDTTGPQMQLLLATPFRLMTKVRDSISIPY